MLTQPHPDLGDQAAIDAITPATLDAVIQAILSQRPPTAAFDGDPPTPKPVLHNAHRPSYGQSAATF
jgi:hypothetical protein